MQNFAKHMKGLIVIRLLTLYFMKYIILFYSSITLLFFSCQKEEDNNFGSGNNSSNSPELIESQTFSTTPINFDSSFADTKFNNSYLGTYKGVFVNEKTGSGYFIIHTKPDTSLSSFIFINNESINITSIDLKTTSNSITYSINQNGINLELVTDLIGNIYTENFSLNNTDYKIYSRKEQSNDTVHVYLGTWTSEVITPINSFTETGIWNLITSNTTVNGSNGEGFLPGTKNGNTLNGTHADGKYSGNQLKNNCEGTFTWSSRGISGTGNWSSKQAF